MLQIAGSSTKKVLGVLAGPGGVPAAVEALVLQQGIKLASLGRMVDYRSERGAGRRRAKRHQ